MKAFLRRLLRRPLTVHDCICPRGTFDGLRQYRTDAGGAHVLGCPWKQEGKQP